MRRSTESGRGGSRPGAGRRPRYGTPMPRTAFTARPDHIIFYLLLSGNQKTVSAGVQMAVPRLVEQDEKAAAAYKQAQWMTQAAQTELEAEITADEEVTQEMVLRRVLDDLDRFIAAYQDRARD